MYTTNCCIVRHQCRIITGCIAATAVDVVTSKIVCNLSNWPNNTKGLWLQQDFEEWRLWFGKEVQRFDCCTKDVAHMNSVPFLMMTFKVFLKTLYFHNHTSVSCQIRGTYCPIPCVHIVRF